MRASRSENVLSPQAFDHRAVAREEIGLPAVIVVAAARHNVLLRNLSSAGAMIVTSAPLLPDMKVELQCGTICAIGTVIWQRKEEFGIKFDNPLGEQQLDEQATRSDAVASWREGRSPVSGVTG